MKINGHIKAALLALVGFALAGSTCRTEAQTVITNGYTNTFELDGNTDPFSGTGSVASWLYWYNTPGNNIAITNDPTMDAGGDPSSGSMEISSPFDPSLGGNNQNIFFGTFGNQYGYDFSTRANLLVFSNLSCDIHVLPGLPLSTNGDFSSLGIGIVDANYGYHEVGRVTIPATATNGWTHLSVDIDKTQPFVGTPVPGFAFNYNWYNGNYPSFPMTFWIDNVAANAPPAPPPPPPTLSSLQPAVVGLNCIAAVAGTSGQYNRYQIATVADSGYTFVGKPNVTYSWNISSFPPNTGENFQQHFFLVNGAPGQYDQAADYNLAQCIFITVQQANDGTAALSFRYKTNEPGGNAMLFNTVEPTLSNSLPTFTTNNGVVTTNVPLNPNFWPVQPIVVLNASSAVGTWSVSFQNTTNVTITGPGGTNVTIALDPDVAALFADPATIILGGQPNNPNGAGKAVVYSQFSVTGNDSPFTDNFATDAALDMNTWTNLSNDTNGVVLVPPGSAYWLSWTLPDNGYSLQATANLSTSNAWEPVDALTILDNGHRAVLLAATNLPSTNSGYFSLVKHVFTKLQVLLPGETAAPNTAAGKTGTPTPVNNGDVVTFTVNAVDANWNPVSGASDTIHIDSSDANAVLPLDAALLNGTAQFSAIVGTSGTVTFTASDVTDTSKSPDTSSPLTVN